MCFNGRFFASRSLSHRPSSCSSCSSCSSQSLPLCYAVCRFSMWLNLFGYTHSPFRYILRSFSFSFSFASISNCFCCCKYISLCVFASHSPKVSWPAFFSPFLRVSNSILESLLLLLLATGWQMVLIWLMNVLIKQNRHLSLLNCHLTLAKNRILTI